MSEKLLSQECVDYCNITKNLSEIEDKLNGKIYVIVELYDTSVDSIEHYSLDTDNKILNVNYSYSSEAETYYDTFDMPIEWLDLDNTEIRKLIKIRKEEELRIIKELAAKAEERRKEEVEEKERQEYERLKAKFETKDNNEK
jgi:hypothetical protein